MKNYTIDEMYYILLGQDIVTENEMSLVTSINGYNEETLMDMLFVRTGYRSFEQMAELEGWLEEE